MICIMSSASGFVTADLARTKPGPCGPSGATHHPNTAMAPAKILALGLMCSSTLAVAASLLQPKGKADALLPVDEAFEFQGATRKGPEVTLDWAIAPGYYLYGHTLKVSVDAPANVPFSGPVLPKGELIKDAEFGDVEVYRGVMQAKLTLPADAKAPRTLRVRYQGCADIGVCYPPQTRIVAVK